MGGQSVAPTNKQTRNAAQRQTRIKFYETTLWLAWTDNELIAPDTDDLALTDDPDNATETTKKNNNIQDDERRIKIFTRS